jgi:hypothetical protein
MIARCSGCDAALEPEWVACPHCGRPVDGHASVDKIVPIVAKVSAGILEAGLLQAESDAEEMGERTRAAQLAILRGLSKEVIPLVADAVLTYSFQRRLLAHQGHDGSALPPDPQRRRPAARLPN